MTDPAARAEAAWSEHFKALEHPIAAIRDALKTHAAATGVGMGPQLDAAASIAAGAVVEHADAIAAAASAKNEAIIAETERDQAAAATPPEPEPAPRVLDGDPATVREWLKTAGATDIDEALAAVDAEHRQGWAQQLSAWVAEDGNTAAVIEALRAATTP